MKKMGNSVHPKFKVYCHFASFLSHSFPFLFPLNSGAKPKAPTDPVETLVYYRLSHHRFRRNLESPSSLRTAADSVDNRRTFVSVHGKQERVAIWTKNAGNEVAQERFYFGDFVLPCFESAVPLLKSRLQDLVVVYGTIW